MKSEEVINEKKQELANHKITVFQYDNARLQADLATRTKFLELV